MTISELRKELGLTLGEFAARLSLSSKGHAHDLETGRYRPSVRVALEIEAMSGGRIPAGAINPDVALVRASQSEAA